MGLLSAAGMGPLSQADLARLRQQGGGMGAVSDYEMQMAAPMPAPQPMPPQGMGPVSNADMQRLMQPMTPPQGLVPPMSEADMRRMMMMRQKV